MHGLKWRMPLLIELDELHRPCVIDSDLQMNKSQYALGNSSPGGEDRGEGKETHECA